MFYKSGNRKKNTDLRPGGFLSRAHAQQHTQQHTQHTQHTQEHAHHTPRARGVFKNIGRYSWNRCNEVDIVVLWIDGTTFKLNYTNDNFEL